MEIQTLITDIKKLTQYFGKVTYMEVGDGPIRYEARGKLVHQIEILNEDSVQIFVYEDPSVSDIPLDNFEVKLDELPAKTLDTLLGWCNEYQSMVYHNDITDRFFVSEQDSEEDNTFMVVTEKAKEIFETGIFDLHVLCPMKQTKITDEKMLMVILGDEYKIGINVTDPYKS